MPHECIKDSTSRTTSGLSTFSSVIGHIPPLAKVAAMKFLTILLMNYEQKLGMMFLVLV